MANDTGKLSKRERRLLGVAVNTYVKRNHSSEQIFDALVARGLLAADGSITIAGTVALLTPLTEKFSDVRVPRKQQ